MSQWRPSRVKIAPLLAVPTSFSQRFPSTKKSRVGMDCTPYQKLRLGLSSASTRTTSTTPAHDVNTSTSTGSMIWQGLAPGRTKRHEDGFARLQDCWLEIPFTHGSQGWFLLGIVHILDCCFSLSVR